MTSLLLLATSSSRAQKADGTSPHTIRLNRDCVVRLIRWCDDDLANVTRRSLTDFYAVRSETVAPALCGPTGRLTGSSSSGSWMRKSLLVLTRWPR